MKKKKNSWEIANFSGANCMYPILQWRFNFSHSMILSIVIVNLIDKPAWKKNSSTIITYVSYSILFVIFYLEESIWERGRFKRISFPFVSPCSSLFSEVFLLPGAHFRLFRIFPRRNVFHVSTGPEREMFFVNCRNRPIHGESERFYPIPLSLFLSLATINERL